MYRLVIPAAGLAIFALGCQSVKPQQQTKIMYDGNYTIRKTIPRPQHLTTRKLYKPPAKRPKFNPFTETWYPRNGKISRKWKTIVLHHSATERGGAKLFDKHHRQKGWDGLGYHFVIGNGTDTPDGTIETGLRWHQQKHGAHCKTPNNFYNDRGIGICLVGDFTRQPPTRKQMVSLNKLTRFLCDQCKIPPNRVLTHHLINKKTKCPGKHFPVDSVRRSIFSSTLPALHRPLSASSFH